MDSTTSSLTSQPRMSRMAVRTRCQMPWMSRPSSSRGSSAAAMLSSSWKSWRSISISVGLNSASSSCSCSVKPERALLRPRVTGSRISGALTRTCGLSGRVQTRKPRAMNSVFAPPSCKALRAPRYSSTRRPSSSGSGSETKTSRRASASSAWAWCRSSRLRASCSCWLRGSWPCIGAGLGSRRRLWPCASASSSAGACASSSKAFLPGLKFSSELRSDRSSSLRCQRASRSLGSSSAVGIASAWRSGSSGASSTPGSSAGSVCPCCPCCPSSAGATSASTWAWVCASGLMRDLRARRMSMASSKRSSSSSDSCRLAWAMAWLKPTARPWAASVASKSTISCSFRRLRTAVTSSTTAVENSSSCSHRPTKAWPRVTSNKGLRPACSRQAANSSVKSRQVARPPSSTCEGLRTFCPACSKLAGGRA